MSMQNKTHCSEVSVIQRRQETKTNTESIKKTQKSPTDPVYLDIDQSLVNRKQSTQ